ncbi:TPA: hypothetical protein ACHOWJ_004508, partial [Escherichia coli]
GEENHIMMKFSDKGNLVAFCKNTKRNPFHDVLSSKYQLNINTLTGNTKTLIHSITSGVINHIMIDM